ncbi:unnamed protein product [Caenorhabditis sp. 36 PRJEB53466]|nr:unnamed protein product [Caenorhabditis sp. 36 PRJEB53466]
MSSTWFTTSSSINSCEYYATWDYPESSCMYSGSVSIIPKLSKDASEVERKVHRYAVNLENGVHLVHSLIRLIRVPISLDLYRKYGIRELCHKYLYQMDTTDHVVNLIGRIKSLERKEQRKKEENMTAVGGIKMDKDIVRLFGIKAPTARSTESESDSSPSPPPTNNIFLTGSAEMSAKLDELLAYVKSSKCQ